MLIYVDLYSFKLILVDLGDAGGGFRWILLDFGDAGGGFLWILVMLEVDLGGF